MDKLKLALEDLVVESFSPATVRPSLGTVHANQSGDITDECQSCGVDTGCGAGGCNQSDYCPTPGCPTASCPGYYTCAGVYTCGGVETCVWPDCTAYGNIC